MATGDITRVLLPPKRQYSATRLQQGRALVDSDFNEDAALDDQSQRQALANIVGTSGSPDDGFKVALKPGDARPHLALTVPAGQANVVDYQVLPGSFYLGGMRFELEQPESVLFQRDFLQARPDQLPAAVVSFGTQLTYLRAWEQTVTAVEDRELLERGMGGADSSVRLRRMRRVEVATVQAASCDAAFAEVVTRLTLPLFGVFGATFDFATGELKSNARLRIEFLEESTGECPACDPSPDGQYLGDENSAIRIMLTTPVTYVWAFGNAAPLHRGRIVFDDRTADGTRIELLTVPKDASQMPRRGTVVELMPWSALLENDEKLAGGVFGLGRIDADTAVGVISRATTDFNAADGSFRIRPLFEPDLQTLKNQRWDSRHPDVARGVLNPGENERFVYVRLWHVAESDADAQIVINSGRPLGRTGLIPRFDSVGRSGDYWVIAARTAARGELVPREFLSPNGVAPHGPREFLAPLALVTWANVGFGQLAVTVNDCRPRVRRLGSDCCTIAVTPGDSIQRAIDQLPPGGGQVCLAPGEYREELVIRDRKNVIIQGCGGKSRIVAPETPAAEHLIEIRASDEEPSRIELRDVALEPHGQTGVFVTGRGVTLRRLTIQSLTASNRLPSAVVVSQAQRFRLLESRITLNTSGLTSASPHAAVYAQIEHDGIIEKNHIETTGSAPLLAWGGLQLGGPAERVEVRRNTIVGGLGHGITLGSVRFRATTGSERPLEGAGRGQINASNQVTGSIGTIQITIEGTPTTFFPRIENSLVDVSLIDNRVEGMANNGISSLAVEVVHQQTAIDPPLCHQETRFVLGSASLIDNRVLGNVATPAPIASLGPAHVLGGIVLSEASTVTVRGNQVVGNGAATTHPVAGFYLNRGQDVVLEKNEIRANGQLLTTPIPAQGAAPVRGGIVLYPTSARAEPGEIVAEPKHAISRVFVRNNRVVQPEGPALLMIVRGSTAVTGNYLSSEGNNATMAIPGPAVTIISLGRPWEAVELPAGEPSDMTWFQPFGSFAFLNGRALDFPTGGGSVLFSHNQVNSIWSHPLPGEAFDDVAVAIISLDDVIAKGNQLAASLHTSRKLRAHFLVASTTLNVAHNRVAEGVLDADLSFADVSAMIGSTTDNQFTHCFAGYLCHPLTFINTQGNLVWLTPTTPVGCLDTVNSTGILTTLNELCGELFSG